MGVGCFRATPRCLRQTHRDGRTLLWLRRTHRAARQAWSRDDELDNRSSRRPGPGTDPLYLAIPVFLALRPGLAYGVFFNNTWRSRFDIGASRPGVWLMEAEGGELDYYVIYGPTPEQVSEGLGLLLGTMPLPPR